MNDLYALGINDEYCWTHTPGGWTCQTCRAQENLLKFFQAVSDYLTWMQPAIRFADEERDRHRIAEEEYHEAHADGSEGAL